MPADHVSRSPNDTYYIDSDTVLRCHTSAHQAATLRAGHSAFLITGARPGPCTSALPPLRGYAGQALCAGGRSSKSTYIPSQSASLWRQACEVCIMAWPVFVPHHEAAAVAAAAAAAAAAVVASRRQAVKEGWQRQPTRKLVCAAGDVYRRDSIDQSHYPVFHQMEGDLFACPCMLSGVCGEHPETCVHIRAQLLP